MERDLEKFQEIIDSDFMQDVLNGTFDGIDLSGLKNIDLPELMETLETQKVRWILKSWQTFSHIFIQDTWSTLHWVSRALSCYETNRFIPMKNEESLSEKAQELAENGTFFAGKIH